MSRGQLLVDLVPRIRHDSNRNVPTFGRRQTPAIQDDSPDMENGNNA